MKEETTNFINSRVFNSPRKGEIYLADIEEIDERGCEIKKTRPVLIFSNDSHNYSRDVVMMLPLSKADHKRTIDLSTQVLILADRSNGLEKDSLIILEQGKGLSKQRLRKYLGTVNNRTLNDVHKAFLRYCDINVLYL